MRKNYLQNAFMEHFNTIGLSLAASLSCVTLHPWPVILAAVFETGYLLFVPDSAWYRKRMNALETAAAQAARAEEHARILGALRSDTQARFRRLEALRQQIGSAYDPQDAQYFREIEENLDFLIDKFLSFAYKEVQFREYLRVLFEQAQAANAAEDVKEEKSKRKSASDPGWVSYAVEIIKGRFDRDREALIARVEKEKNTSTRSVLMKRAEVLLRRQAFLDKAEETLLNINSQLELFEDTFGLINDEIRAHSPEQILADIEAVVVNTHSMTAALEELGPIEQQIMVHA